MTHIPLRKSILVGLIVLGILGLEAMAQVVPTAPKGRGALPPGWSCTVETFNQSEQAHPNGSVDIANVSADQELLRLQATCRDESGNTLKGHTVLKVPVAGGETVFADFDFDTLIATPQSLSLEPNNPRLEQINQTLQLTATATTDGVSTDVTMEPATFFSSSDNGVAIIDSSGLLTAKGNGRAIIMASHEGRLGLAVAAVMSSPVTAVEVLPAAITLAPHTLFPTPSAQLSVEGILANMTRVDLTPMASGTTYSSSNRDIAFVTDDGLVVATGQGTATITATNGGQSDAAAVEVEAPFTPAPLVTYDTPGGFARNLDISGSLLYVADDTNGLQIFDRADGYIGKKTFGAPAMDVKIRGSLAAVGLGSSGGIALVDVSDPTSPIEISRILGFTTCRDLWLSGDRLYAAADSELIIYDISDPAAPTLVGSKGFASEVNAVAGDTGRNIAVVLIDLAVEILQITPTQPWPSARIALPNGDAGDIYPESDDIFLLGSTAYLTNAREGAHAIDISIPSNPIRRYNTSDGAINPNARGIAARQTSRGPLVAVADYIFVDTVPLFDDDLIHLHNLDFGGDAEGEGIALGNGFGAVAVGVQGIKLFTIDDITDNLGRAPTVTITAPVQAQNLDENRDFDFRALAVDDVEVDRVEFFVNGGIVATDTRRPYATELNLAAGNYDLRADAVDGGGNRGISQTVNIDVITPMNPPIPGHVLSDQKLSIGNGGLMAGLQGGDNFGRSSAALGDLDGLGPSAQALAVGAPRDDDGGTDRGAVYILFLDSGGMVIDEQKISSTSGGLTGTLDNFDEFGTSVAAIGDIDADGVPDLAVGALGDDDGGFDVGAAHILLLNANGTVKAEHKISANSDMVGRIQSGDGFGGAMAYLGFYDLGLGASPTLVVGAPFDDDGATDTGAAYVLALNPDGSVNSQQKISAIDGAFGGAITTDDSFACALSALGDLDGDSIDDLAIGALGDSEAGSFFRGAMWIIFMNADGTVKGQQKINSFQGGFSGTLEDEDLFASASAPLGDLDDDGVPDLAVSAPFDDDGGPDRGAIWILFLNPNGTVKAHEKISSTSGNFVSILDDGDEFSSSLTPLGDLDGDGKMDLAVGANRDDDGGGDTGAIWVLFLDGFLP